MEIKPGSPGSPEAVTYSGPTYIAIRSAKHSSSNANTHAEDLNTIFGLELCTSFVRTAAGGIKPVLMISCDGGPDENPKYPKVIAFAIQHFQENDLDAVFVVTNAPGRSAFNRVERKMAPLSAQLAGLVLPAATYGTHLSESGKTVDDKLELKNFIAAGQVLEEVWNSLEIDGHKVLAEFKKPGTEPELPPTPDPLWYSLHVQESQYALQIVKCRNPSCCKPMRGSLFDVLPNRFHPPPCPLRRTEVGLILPKPSQVNSKDHFLPLFQRLSLQTAIPIPSEWQKMPYDMYCPTLSNADLNSRICQQCGHYFASKKAAVSHTKGIHNQKTQGGHDNSSKPKPTRVYGRRRKEVLCAFRNERFDTIECEWQEETDVDMRGVTVDAGAESQADAEIRTAADWAKNDFSVEE